MTGTVTLRPSDAAKWADAPTSPHTTAMRFDRRLGDQLAEVQSQMFTVGSIADPEITIAPIVPISWRTQLLLVARKMGRTEAADTLRVRRRGGGVTGFLADLLTGEAVAK